MAVELTQSNSHPRNSSPAELLLLEGAGQVAADREPVGGRLGDPTDVPQWLDSQQRLCDAFFATVERHAERTALVTARSAFSYAVLGRLARAIAASLQSHARFCAGDRVALMLDNSPEFIAAYYGVLAAGGVLVPLPANVEAYRLERIRQICDIRLILSSHRALRRRDDAGDMPRQILDLTSFDAPPALRPLGAPDSQSPAMIMFTSGSSGDPKGVMLSDRNLLANTQSILQYLPITHEDRALALLPFYHAFGHSILQTHLLSGATLVVDGNMVFPNSVLEALQRHRATSFSAVPEGYYALLGMSELGARDFPHLRYMSVAGGGLKPASVTEVARRIAPARFFVMYGQTEAAARLAYLPPDHVQTHPHSIGVAIPGVQLCVRGPDGRIAPAGEIGELCARGPNVMLGYWNDSAGTQEAVCDGWLRTGDLARRDEQGFFFIQARKNDLVKVQGFRVHPREVEEAMSEHFPALRIIVVPYAQQGTTRLALFGITRNPEQQLVEQLRHACHRLLPRHKTPSLIELLPRAPLNASMKLDRTALRQRAEAQGQLPFEEGSHDRRSEKRSA